MIRLYTTLLFAATFAGSSTLSAQIAPKPEPDALPAAFHGHGSNDPAADRGGGTPIWSEDFANGLPADWTLEDASGLCPWTWTLDGSHGYFSGGADDVIESTTADNGFIIADNDSANDATYGQPSGTTYHYLSTYFTTSPIDLSGHPNVKLEFEQYFRYNNAPTLDVMVSTNGVNWTTYDVKGTVLANQASTRDDLVSINISNIAGDQSTVYLKIGWNSRVYFWMIDDIRIVDAPADDVRLLESWYNEWFFDSAEDFSTLEYSIYPSTQLRPFQFKGIFSNEGWQPQTDVTFTATVFDADGNQVHSTEATMSSDLDPLAQDSLYTDEWTPTTDPQKYRIEYALSAAATDAVPEDNLAENSFSVSEHTYARDRGRMTSTEDNAGGGFRLGNWFHISSDGDQIYGVDVAIHEDTPVDLIVYAQLLDAERNVIAESQDYEVTASDLHALGDSLFSTIMLAEPVELEAGADYLVMVGHYGGPDRLYIGNSGVSVEQTSLIWSDPDNDWFYVTRTPMVRMNLDPNVGVADNTPLEKEELRIAPNPCYNGSTTISYTLTQASTVKVEVRDVQGKLVLNEDAGRRGAGPHRMDLDVSGLTPGVYSCSIWVDDARLTERLVTGRW
jgi:hypothetical protein